MNLAQLLVRSARTFPNAPAIFQGKRLYCDYQTLARKAGQLAESLAQKKILFGARAVIYMTNTPEYLEVLYGLWFGGLTVVPVNPKLHPREVATVVQDASAEIVFISSDLANDAAELLGKCPSVRAVIVPRSPDFKKMEDLEPRAEPVDCTDDHLAWLFYTSGTTGIPKGVMLSHRNLFALTMSYFADVDSVSSDDSMIYAAPMSHGAGIYNFSHIHKAARHVIPESKSFNSKELTDLANYHGRATLFAAPTMVKRLVDHIESKEEETSGFKTIVYGGGPMYLEDIRHALKVMGSRFVQIYGQGECPMTITSLSRDHLSNSTNERYLERIASVGVPQAIVQVRVADQNGSELQVGQVGEILVRGDTVMMGYWNNPDASRQALRSGWLWTGDIGVFDKDGFLTLKDRSKDVIISGGSNIYPREIEEVLLAHPNVLEVSVVGSPHPEWGEQVTAFVVVRPGSSLLQAELDAFCIENIARFKRPRTYYFVDELPKNNYGKVLKRSVRELIGGNASEEQDAGIGG